MSYFSNITNDELQYFHGLKVPNFTIKLSDILHKTSDVFDNKLFLIEEIVTDSIYRIFPIFYTNTISSTNPNDSIIDDKVIICTVMDTETFVTLISDESEPVQDYISYGTYFEIGDSLTLAEYNSIVSLLRANTVNNDTIKIADTVNGVYGDYLFDIDGCTILDSGILITDETTTAQPKVKLVNPKFRYATYTLQLTVIHYTDVNILDDTTDDFKVIETLEIELVKNNWVTIPLTDMENGYIIRINANVQITFDKTEIHLINGHTVTATPNPIQTGETTDIYSQLIDYDGEPYNISDASGKTVHFYEVLTPTLTTYGEPSIIQTGGDAEIYAKVKDSDGSIAKNVKVYFYKKTE